MSNWIQRVSAIPDMREIENRVTSVIRKPEIFSENGEHETADNWLDNMITELEIQSELLRDAQNKNAEAALRRTLNPEPEPR